MTYTYHAHHSQIVDFLYVPLFMLEKEGDLEWDINQKEKDILSDVWQIKEEIKDKLSPLDEDLKRYNLWSEAYAISHILYIILLDKGHDPKTLSEALDLFETLSEQDIIKAYQMTLVRSYIEEEIEAVPLLTYLDKVEMSAENKWYWYQAINSPKETVEGLIKVLRQVETIYAPYYEQFASERQSYLEAFGLESFFAYVPMAGMSNMAEQYQTTYELILLSPIHIRVMAMFFTKEFSLPIWLVTSTRMDQLLNQRDVLDMDSFSTILKTMSDISRYQVLTELIQPHAKNKVIAEKLGITGAAVSFHTQKLINSKLLLVDHDNQTTKYKLNQGLIQQMIDKLTGDFNLEQKTSEQKTVTEEKEDMPVVIKDGIWYDQAGRPLTEEEKAQVKDQVYAELDKDLKDTGFEGLIKKFIKYLMTKNGKGLGKYLHMDSQKTLVGWQPEVGSSDAKEQPLPTDSSELAEELIDVEEDLADVGEELTDVNSEIEDLTTELEILSANLARLQAEEERLKARRQAILKRYGELSH
ncbi:hypothetical protein ACVRZR_05110 [Streptococcus entericus]|uniref:coiled-coil domain-containing protein n=1 Tax=Streptococcus entericus TaxID=155680 RepID=UPI000380864F|nr:transcriptional regulator [Streptococcus entericus]